MVELEGRGGKEREMERTSVNAEMMFSVILPGKQFWFSKAQLSVIWCKVSITDAI